MFRREEGEKGKKVYIKIGNSMECDQNYTQEGRILSLKLVLSQI